MNGNYVEFALIDAQNSGYAFSTYMDKDGNVCFITKYKNDYGKPVRKNYEFNQSRRIIRVPKAQKEEIEFLRNHPECEGSPNGIYSERDGSSKQLRAFFREINEGKDASTVVAATKDRVKAQNLALKLADDPVKLRQVAYSCGCFKQDAGIQLSHILQYAETSPIDFVDIVTAPELESSYLVIEAMRKGVMKKVGLAVKYGDLSFADEEDAIAKVMTDSTIRTSLKKATSKS